MVVFNLVLVVGCLNCFSFFVVSCGFPTEGGINILFLLIGSDVKTLLAHMPQESMETFISYITRLSEEAKKAPKLVYLA